MAAPLRRSLRLLKHRIAVPAGAPPAADLLHSLLSRLLLTALTLALAAWTACTAAASRARAAGAAARHVWRTRCVFYPCSGPDRRD